MILQGWTYTTSEELQPYQQRQDQLSVHDGCVLLGSRAVIPPAGRTKVLEELYQGHPGITRMKGLARSFVWWPGMDKELEQKVKFCANCQQYQNTPAAAPLHPWEWPKRPWSRIHVDYAGPFLGKMFLITVDGYSKWIDAQVVNTATSYTTVERLRTLFATHGIPEVLVTDNGTPFTSTEFSEFTKRNGIRHVRVSPYHPSSNGLAERAVKTFKEGMKKAGNKGSIECRMARLLFQYRITPHSTTGVSPAELLLGRCIHSHLGQLRPDLSTRVESKQEAQKRNHDNQVHPRTFQMGDPVFVRNFGRGPTWLSGNIEEIRGPLSYSVSLTNGQIVRKHIDQIRGRTVTSPETTDGPSDDFLPNPLADSTASSTSDTTTSTAPPLRRSTRIRNPPDRYSPDNYT